MPALRAASDGNRIPALMACTPMRVRNSSLAQPMASTVPCVCAERNWKAAASRLPRLLANRKQPASALPAGIHG
jgi:hypothetical protein